MEKAKKMKCCKRLIYITISPSLRSIWPTVSELLPKHLTHHYGALYGDAIFVHSFGTQIWPPEINKMSGVHFSYRSSFFSLKS